jgi:hypothetical protein
VSDHYTTTTVTETLVTETDEKKLAAPIAEAIARDVRNGIAAITQLARDGKHRLFNKTGALRDGIRAIVTGDTFEIVAPPDHFQNDPDGTLQGKLVALVPVLQDPTNGNEYRKALEQSAAAVVKIGPTKTEST